MDFFRDYVRADEYLNRAIVDFNGDVTMWGVYFLKGIARLRLRDPVGARIAFSKACYYNPNFEAAHRKLNQVEKLIEDSRGSKISQKASEVSGSIRVPESRRQKDLPSPAPLARF
jgi:hypothetical protein